MLSIVTTCTSATLNSFSTWDPRWQPAQASVAVQVQNTSLEPHSWPPPTYALQRLAPHPSPLSPCMPCAQWPITSLRCSAHARGETVQQPQEYMCTAAVGPHLALSSATGLHHWAHQHPAPSAVHLYTPGLTPNTKLHHHMPVVRTSSHSGAREQLHSHSCRLAHSWPWPLLFALAPITTRVFAASLCRSIGTCSWPLETSVCIPPALANTVICQVPGHRTCRCCWGPQ